MSDKLKKVGRLALRREGQNWNAYYATEATMDGAIPLGSIRMAIIEGNEKHKQAFMDLMREVVSDLIEHTVGERPTWNEPQSAPEHEKSGHS